MTMKQLLIYFSLLGGLILGPAACGLFQSCPEALPYFQIAGLELNHYRFNDDPYGDLHLLRVPAGHPGNGRNEGRI